MDNLHLHGSLIGALLNNSHGSRARIVAIYLTLDDYKFNTIVVDSYGRLFKLELPDPDWEIDANNHDLIPPINYKTG